MDVVIGSQNLEQPTFSGFNSAAEYWESHWSAEDDVITALKKMQEADVVGQKDWFQLVFGKEIGEDLWKIVYGSQVTPGVAGVVNLTEGSSALAYEEYVFQGHLVSEAEAASAAASELDNLVIFSEATGAVEAGASATAVGAVASVGLGAAISAGLVLLGYRMGEDIYKTAYPDADKSFYKYCKEKLARFLYKGTECVNAVINKEGQLFLPGRFVGALGEMVQELEWGTGGDETTVTSEANTGLEMPMVIYQGPTTVETASTGGVVRRVIVPEGVTVTIYQYSSGRRNPIILASNQPFNYTTINTSATGQTIEGTKANTASFEYEGKTVYRAGEWSTINSSISDGKYSNPIAAGSSGIVVDVTAWVSVYGDITSGGALPEGIDAWTGADQSTTLPARTIRVLSDTETGATEPYYPAYINPGDPLISPDPVEVPDPGTQTVTPEIGTEYIQTVVNPDQIPEFDPNSDANEIPVVDPDKLPYPQPNFDPDADPSAQPDPEPAPEFDPQPPIPIPDGMSPPTIFPIPDIEWPSIVPTGSSGLIHVYNPSNAQMVDFGRWLWVTYADNDIQKLWNNPFDGVISAHELYATPNRGATENIRSGFLTSTASAPIVPIRYTTINCGSIVVPEYYGNYLDYSPYSKAHVYLPFIGIVELNVDDIVGHGVNITYHVDAYNGSCIAQITVSRGSEGYSNTIYQFSGNCACEIPLAGGSQAAIRSGMIGAAATGLTSIIGGIASLVGGRIGSAITGIAGGVGSAVTQAVSQKSSVQHSGTFGASYGAMGIKKPYIMVHRPIQKGVYNYARDYGYPAHKRVRIGNCSGFLRVREVNVISSKATDEEKARIEELLKEGVYVT